VVVVADCSGGVRILKRHRLGVTEGSSAGFQRSGILALVGFLNGSISEGPRQANSFTQSFCPQNGIRQGVRVCGQSNEVPQNS
jgi:hypothetical protein